MFVAALCVSSFAEPVRIATYNIRMLSSVTGEVGGIKLYDVRTQADRLEKLRDTIGALDADIIGLEEIADLDALQLVFPGDEWTLVFDDDSQDCLNLAMAVRQPLTVIGAKDGFLDAEPEHFLFEDADEFLFPRNRDVLAVPVALPEGQGSIVVMVTHAKSRLGGRPETNLRRVGAAQALVKKLKTEFAGADCVLLGDFNDNPDDQALNTLETGSLAAVAEMENEKGSLLVNLTEQLAAAGHVSWGLTGTDVTEDVVNTLDPDSRQRNFDHRFEDVHTGKILFDQILVSPKLAEAFVPGSAKVFDGPVAVQGGQHDMASDHLPVYADFDLSGTSVAAGAMAIVGQATGDVLYEENFESSGSSEGKIGELSVVSVASNHDWVLDEYGDNHYAEMNGYRADTPSDDWLITPAFDLAAHPGLVLTFDLAYNFDGPAIEVLLSADYDRSVHANPGDATWVALPATIPASGGYTFLQSAIDLSAYSGANVHIAWHYTSNGPNSGESRLWQVDNITVTESAAATAGAAVGHSAGAVPAKQGDLRVATFNTSLYRNNEGDLEAMLSVPGNLRVENVAEIIQRVDPDMILLNEFDYVASGAAVQALKTNYLEVGQNGASPISFPYTYIAPSNTGIDTGLDLNDNGTLGEADDAYGYGTFPGQYGMAFLSKYPIDTEAVRTFQLFKWDDMPGNLLPTDYYEQDEIDILRLSSKNHWDIPVNVGGKTVHVLCSHPTPPVFDGAEDRNGKRNYDEIGLWADYVSESGNDYIYDDNGLTGGLPGIPRFVVLGDHNADPDEGDGVAGAIQQLLDHTKVDGAFVPESAGALEQEGDATDTATFGLRADYVLPSNYGFAIEDGGVFWPETTDPEFSLVHGTGTSDHRLVWLDLTIETPDTDGDGIADDVEGGGDADGDGVPDYQEVDADADGLGDAAEGTGDVDNDGIPNFLDTDSDGDGAGDALETAQGTNPYDAADTPNLPVAALPILGAMAVAVGFYAARSL